MKRSSANPAVRQGRNKMRRLSPAIVLVAALLGAGLVSSCAMTDDIETILFDTRTLNLPESSYAAADSLGLQANARVTPATPMRVAIPADVLHPDETTPFGTLLANQLGSRFVQLGYNVQAAPMPLAVVQSVFTGAPVPLTSGPAPRPTQGAVRPSIGKGGECIVGGTYTRLKKTIMVNLRVYQGPEQRIIAAYDYSLPLTRELRDLSLSADERSNRSAQPATAIPAAE